MNCTVVFCTGLLLCCLAGCTDTHPDMPVFPQSDNARIRVDSLAKTRVHAFIFSADKTKIYAIVLTASTGVFADHTLVEFDQTGHRLREIPLGEMSIRSTELALLPGDSLLWQSSSSFYIFDLQQFTVKDKVRTYWAGEYPDAQKDNDQARVAEESQIWLRQQQQKIGRQFDIQQSDSVTHAVLAGNKANADAYWAALQEAQSQQRQFESDRHEAYYEAYALTRIQQGILSFGYRSLREDAAYVFTKFANGSSLAFMLDKPSIQKAGVNVFKCDVNASVNIDRTNLCLGFSSGESATDRTSALRVTEKMVTAHNTLLMNGRSDQYLLYYELKVGAETGHFKWLFPFGLSNDYYLQSANGSAFLLKEGVLYWFHV